MMKISLYRRQALAEKILGGDFTPESLERFKNLSPPELRKRFREALYEDLSDDRPGFSSKALRLSLEAIGSIGAYLRKTDKKYRIDNGLSVLRGVDHNFELEFRYQVYHYSAGISAPKYLNGDSLVSIVNDEDGVTGVHALFDGSPLPPKTRSASQYAADILEKAALVGFIEDGTDLTKVVRETHERLAEKGLATTGTFALVKGGRYEIFWAGNSPAVSLKKTHEGYDATLLTADTGWLIGRGQFGRMGQASGTLGEGDALLFHSDGFLNSADKHQLKMLEDEYRRKTQNIVLFGLGPSLTYPRFYYGRFEEKEIEGPYDDSSVLVIRR
jgi:hypothetical protein